MPLDHPDKVKQDREDRLADRAFYRSVDRDMRRSLSSVIDRRAASIAHEAKAHRDYGSGHDMTAHGEGKKHGD